jgi:hypothetical protein
MLRRAAGLLLLTLLFSGCALCANCDDENYSAYGGRWEREVMNHGRVGSAFEPAGHLNDGVQFVVDRPTPANDENDVAPNDVAPNDVAPNDAPADGEAGEREASYE